MKFLKKQIHAVVQVALQVIVVLLTVICVAGFILCLFYQKWEAAATIIVGTLATVVIWWQGTLIKKQIHFQSFIELDKEWRSPEMLRTRETAFNESTRQYDIFKLENILAG